MKIDLTKLNNLAEAKRLAKEGFFGWVTPGGGFDEAPDVGSESIRGLSLGRHEAAALTILERSYPLLYDKLNKLRIKRGHKTWPDSIPMIRVFMQANGFVRVSDDILSISDFE